MKIMRLLDIARILQRRRELSTGVKFRIWETRPTYVFARRVFVDGSWEPIEWKIKP